jgi:hypothetical protein
MQATLGPRGEITALRVDEVLYVSDAAVCVAKPGWSGTLADQRAADPASVRVSTADGATVYTMDLPAPGGALHLTEAVRLTPEQLRVEYELTPEVEVTAEAVYVQSLLPAAVHAGATRYLVAGATVAQGLLPAAVSPDSHVIVGGGLVDWAGFAAAGGSGLRVVPSDLTAQLQDNRRWDLPHFGLLTSAPGGRLTAGKTIRLGLTYTATTAAALEAEARELARNDVAGMRLGDDRALAIGKVTADGTTVEVFAPLELSAEIAATYEDPFDPRQIDVSAEVTAPGGQRLSVPGFYYVPLTLEVRLAAERLLVAGRPDFRVRYTPTTPGLYRVVLKATDRSGTAESAPLGFTAGPGKHPGFVRVAKGSPRYFACDDGRPFFAVGENVCWSWNNRPLSNYGDWFKGLGAAGGNWARLFLSNGEKGQEWLPAPTPKPGTGAYLGLGRYALDNAWRLDQIVRLARENGLRVMFCLGTAGEFYSGGYFNEGCWVSNPYNAANGGPCAKPEDFWTDPEARRLYQQRLRYLIARWGFSPDLFAWEFWNEVPPTPDQEAWLAEMAAYVKRHDPNRHLVSTTYGNPAVWSCPDVDFTMRHLYGTAGNTADFTPLIVSQTRESLTFGKPFLMAEFGIDWQTSDRRWDPKGTGLSLHNGAWAALMAGAAGTTMLWYWDDYVHPNDLYHVLTPVRRFADTVPWASTRFEPLVGVTAQRTDDAPETFADLTIPASQDWGTTPSPEYTVGRDGSVQGTPVAMTLGSPVRGNPGELYTKLVWHLDLPQAAKVVARLGQVCTRARLEVSVDGAVVLDRELPAGEPGKGPWQAARYLAQYQVWVSDYQEDIAIDVPAGQHTVAFANTAGDWLQIPRLTLPGYRSSRYPDVNLVGLRGEGLVLLWVHNRESTWRTEFDGKQPAELGGLRVTLPVAQDGTWQVQRWDTSTGEATSPETVRAADGVLALDLPCFARDVALRLAKTN